MWRVGTWTVGSEQQRKEAENLGLSFIFGSVQGGADGWRTAL